MKKTIWIVAAAAFEIENFADMVLGLKSDWQLFPFLCGVGTHQSLSRLTLQLSQKEKPAAIVQVGTAGVFKVDGLPLQSLLLARDFLLPPHMQEEYPELIAEQFSFAALPLFEKEKTHSPNNITNIARYRVFSSLGISTCEKKFLIDSPNTLPLAENMEAYSLAFVAHKNTIPFNALLCVSNYIGKDGRRQFQENYTACGKILTTKLQELFAVG